MSDNLQDLLSGLNDDQVAQVYNEFTAAVNRVRTGSGGDLPGLVNQEAAKILALTGAELSDEDKAALRKAGAEEPDPERYLAQVKAVAAGAKKRKSQAGLMTQYRAEMEQAGGQNERLMIRARYRRQGLDI